MATSHHNTGLRAFDRLENVHSAYLSVEVMAGYADIDSHHVSNLLLVLNEVLLECIEELRPRFEVSGSSSSLDS